MRRILPTLLAGFSLLVGSLVTAAPAHAAAPDEPPEQWRSYWVDAFNEGIYRPDQVSTLIEDALAVNANALIVQTARRYDCFCNRALYPRTDAGIDPAPYDPLDEVIEQAHAAGLEVHAWINVNTMWNSATPPRSPDHVFNQHGPSAEGTDRWLNKKADGSELQGANAYIDPGHPDAASYIVDAVRSIVSEYDVDGVNLDYIRYPDFNAQIGTSDWGYNEVSLARFQQATGRSDVPAPGDAEWTEWRRDQVTNLVRRIYLGVWETDPQARLSMDAITYGFGPQSVGGWEATRTYTEVLQDWAGWLDEGIMDTAVTMNYKRNWVADQERMFAEWSEFLADNQAGRQAVNGPALYLNSVADSRAQALAALAPTSAGNTAAGWSGYSYANPGMTHVDGSWADRSAERAELAEALTTGEDAPFAERAAVPDMAWKSAPAEGHVTGRLALRDGTPLDQAAVTLKPLSHRGESITRPSDGSGWFGFAHVEPGLYLVRVDLPQGVAGPSVSAVKVGKGRIAEARFSAFTAPR
ncbi:family 10 glycosylhydrolase [Streptomyces sp. ACA25]|uniref:family 10 glycosylhydrolase n=1 Tax=Streptomyces sp. ACA25 TaxID=3022596 RepID=UPI002307A002|nr:family 10 glycosylhydrolase [Streptomyces sp. ACA25]MDB1089666.1 family 10 glycosylhydrolase [Streptomyces sp. ACA25]